MKVSDETVAPPFLSIITPSYNYAQFLRDALDSVHSQLEIRCEHLIVDDGSADDSVHLARTHASKPQVYTQQNAGLAATLNRLLSMATGEWVGWLNADDFYLERSFAMLREVVEGPTRPDVVVGDTVFVDESGRALRLLPAHRITTAFTAHYGMTAAPNAVFVKRSLLAKIGFRENSRILMDKWMMLDLLRFKARFTYSSLPFAAMRRHGGQLSVTARANSDPERKAFRIDAGVASTGYGLTLSRQYGRIIHVGYKLLDGGYLRQRRWHTLKGRSMRWWDGGTPLEAVLKAQGSIVCSSTFER